MSGNVRYSGLLIFFFFSALLHYLVLQLEIAPVAVTASKGAFGVGYVQRSVDLFAGLENMHQATELPRKTKPKSTSLEASFSIKPDNSAKQLEKEIPVRSTTIKDDAQNMVDNSSRPIDVPVSAVETQSEVQVSTEGRITEAQLETDEIFSAVSHADQESRNDAGGETLGSEYVDATSGFVESSEVSQRPLLISAVPRYEINPRPIYPEVARRRGQEGEVSLEVTVGNDGRVEKVAIIKSSGYKSLDRSAVKTVRRWQFTPAIASGIAITSKVQVPIRFGLD